MRRIAFFDFDGTITDRDTLFELIRHQKGNVTLYMGFLLNLPVFAALTLKLISKQSAKERILKFFFDGMPLASFQLGCDLFTDKKLPALIRPDALNEIKKLQELGFEVAIVSASAENWIKKWSDKMGLQLIATQLETINGLMTGKIKGNNCNEEEKAVRIKAAYSLSQYDEIYCYGDSQGDMQMLALGSKTFYKPFRDKSIRLLHKTASCITNY